MTDAFDIEAMIADRENGTPGPWDLRLFQSGTVQVILREWNDGSPNSMAGGSTYGYHSAYMTMYNIGQRDETDTDNEKYHNARRISRVPEMEAEILRLREVEKAATETVLLVSPFIDEFSGPRTTKMQAALAKLKEALKASLRAIAQEGGE